MGFTPQAVGNWIRLYQGWASIEDRVNSGQLTNLTQALKELPKDKGSDQGDGEGAGTATSKFEKMGLTLSILKVAYGLTDGQIVGLLKHVRDVVKSKTLDEMIQMVQDFGINKAA